MSQRALGRALGVDGYEQVKHSRDGGVSYFHLRAPDSCRRCPRCGQRDVIRRGTVERVVHAPRLGLDRTLLYITVPRLECQHCEQVLTATLPNVEPRCQYTKSFARMAIDLRKMMTTRDVADYLGVSDRMIRDIDRKYLAKNFGQPRLKDLEIIAIDEIYLGSRQKYVTIVIDWRTGAIVYVGDGKGAAALDRFWKRLSGSRAKIQAVATDMSNAYYAAVAKHLPQAKHVFDRFHIVKLMNDKLSTLRRELQAEADRLGQQMLKGLRWLLLKYQAHLDPLKNERTRLDEALKWNESLAIAYYLKEDLRQLWEQPDKTTAGKFLTDWCGRAEASGIKVLQTMSKTLRTHRRGLLNWYDFPISSGPMEGINNKIGALQRMAYGYRDKEYFMHKLYALHLAKFALIG